LLVVVFRQAVEPVVAGARRDRRSRPAAPLLAFEWPRSNVLWPHDNVCAHRLGDVVGAALVLDYLWSLMDGQYRPCGACFLHCGVHVSRGSATAVGSSFAG